MEMQLTAAVKTLRNGSYGRILRTRPYTPRTNGNAERFIQTALREWARAKHWASSEERDASLKPWTDYYKLQRPHGSLNYKPPISRSDSGTTS